jgi:ActR/RegA family two-component response regulator
MARAGGNISEAARILAVHRNRVYRFLARGDDYDG